MQSGAQERLKRSDDAPPLEDADDEDDDDDDDDAAAPAPAPADLPDAQLATLSRCAKLQLQVGSVGRGGVANNPMWHVRMT